MLQGFEANMAGVAQVFKRGKAREHGKAEPVNITLEVLEDLGRLPLPRASAMLGISATALKGACRKLGIQRWPYFAGRGLVPAYLPKKDAGTQTDVSFGGVYGCEMPALVDAEVEWDAQEDAVGVWSTA